MHFTFYVELNHTTDALSITPSFALSSGQSARHERAGRMCGFTIGENANALVVYDTNKIADQPTDWESALQAPQRSSCLWSEHKCMLLPSHIEYFDLSVHFTATTICLVFIQIKHITQLSWFCIPFLSTTKMAVQSTLREPDSKKFGQWSPTFDLKNVAVHAHLLPNGKVLYWGRRSNPKSPYASSMSEHVTEPWVLDPSTSISEPTKGEFTNNGYRRNQPKLYNENGDDKLGEDVNLFCSGHTFQPDGTLLAAGGHIMDGWGAKQACVYDYRSDTWTPKRPMNDGRWYPSVIALPDGGVFTLAGNKSQGGDNGQPQIWRTDKSTDVAEDNKTGNFPRMHLHSSGRIFVAGPTANAEFLDVGVVSKDGTVGIWDRNPNLVRPGGDRQYAPSVMYESDKIMIIGGGSNDEQAPFNTVEFINLNDTPPKWTTDPLTDMNHARRHHNATILKTGVLL